MSISSLEYSYATKKSISPSIKERIDVIGGDSFDKKALQKALNGIEVTYYLIHSLSQHNYKELDRVSAQNFVDIASECGVKNEDTSEHLLSRLESGEVLSSHPKVQTIWIRVGVIIQNDHAKDYFPHIKPLSYINAVKKAVEEIEANQVLSRWNDHGAKCGTKYIPKSLAMLSLSIEK